MSARLKAILAMLTLYVVWSTTYLGIKVGLDASLPPSIFLALRLLPAAAIMFLFAKARGSRLRLQRPDLVIIATVGVLLLVGGQYGTYIAEQYVPSGLSALIVALLPLWIALAESIFPDMRRPSALGWIGLGIGFTGLGILVWPQLTRVTAGPAGPAEIAGIAIQIVATWLWAAGSVYSKRHPVRVDGIVVTAWQMLVSGTVVLLIGSLAGEWRGFDLTPKGAAALAYLIVFGSCIAFTAFVYALSHLPASKVMTYAYVNPVIAVLVGWAAGRSGLVPPEPITPTLVAGMVVIVAGVALTTAAPTRPPRRTPSDPAERELAEEPLVEPVPSEV